MSVAYIYRFVRCKNCSADIDVEYLGPAVNVRIAGTIRNPGLMPCQKCGHSHVYVESDIKYTVRDHPPTGGGDAHSLSKSEREEGS